MISSSPNIHTMLNVPFECIRFSLHWMCSQYKNQNAKTFCILSMQQQSGKLWNYYSVKLIEWHVHSFHLKLLSNTFFFQNAMYRWDALCVEIRTYLLTGVNYFLETYRWLLSFAIWHFIHECHVVMRNIKSSTNYVYFFPLSCISYFWS